jgi:uncharacterized protein (TIGR03790 family)
MKKPENILRRALPGLLALLAGVTARAADPPTSRGGEVVVLYNTRVAESRGVAEHYARARGVPAAQVIGLPLPDQEAITRAEYRDRLERPLADALAERGLLTWGALTNAADGRPFTGVTAAKIRALAPCFGVPLKILEDAGLAETPPPEMAEILRRNEAAVDSELALLPWAREGWPRLGPLPNRVFGVTNAALLHPTNAVLLVARLDGPDAATARGLADLALHAETNGLWGRAYFDGRGLTGGPYLTGDLWLTNAAQLAATYGFDTVLDWQEPTFGPNFPLSHAALYAGWYDEHVSGPFTAFRVEFAPGAVAYHLHSYSAATLRGRARHWAGPLVARGAAATMGSTAEPLLDGTPNLEVFFGRLLFLRFTLAEAALAAQRVLSWQTTVVGDPLYRPFALNPVERLAARTNMAAADAAWLTAMLLNLRAQADGGVTNATAILAQQPLLAHSPVLQEKMGDFERLAGRPREAAAWYARAAGSGPSPRQRWRLLRAAGEAHEAAGDAAEAYRWLQDYRRETSDEAERPALAARLARLARELGRAEEAVRWEREAGAR